MSDVFYLVLRRLRAPIIILIAVYSIAILGLTLIPGVDPDGQPWKMSFFHAFYFVSFMGSTIGFGEIPYPFVDAQRVWVAIFMYTTVVSWLYAIGNVLTLVQDSTFKQAISEFRFTRSIQRNSLPFYIICGYGQTGLFINKGLCKLGIQTVIIDIDPERTKSLELENLSIPPIKINADATEPNSIIIAGMFNPHCMGVIAVTNNDHTNLKIAVSCKLLNEKVRVICRSEIEDEAANMASFGTNTIVDPFRDFSSQLSLLAHQPELYQVHDWFVNQHHKLNLATKELPHGNWIICGFGRLGKAIKHELAQDHINITIVDADPIANHAPSNAIVGRGTEASTLMEAGIESASLVVAASNDDANNLSILMTARQLNPEVYTIGRVSVASNQILFERAKCDFIMRSSQLIANRILTIISRPLVNRFIRLSKQLSHQQVCELREQVLTLTNSLDPVTWRLVIDEKNAPALAHHLEKGRPLNIGQVCYNEHHPRSNCLPLLLEGNRGNSLLPNPDSPLEIGDQLLVCGTPDRLLLPQRLVDNDELVDSLINLNPHHVPLMRWWHRRTAETNLQTNNLSK